MKTVSEFVGTEVTFEWEGEPHEGMVYRRLLTEEERVQLIEYGNKRYGPGIVAVFNLLTAVQLALKEKVFASLMDFIEANKGEVS